jgi:hypothetical protein
MSKGEKRVRERRSECNAWVRVLPSMPKGEIVGKYLTDNEWKIFNRHECLSLMASTTVKMASTDGKYNSEDGKYRKFVIDRQTEDKFRKVE